MSGKYEYAVRLHNYEDLDQFYTDIETSGGSDTIPEREVSVAQKLPSSCTTMYWLTVDEAAALENDPRVKWIEWQNPTIEFKPLADYHRSSSQNGTHNNWGLYLHTLEEPDATYGSNSSRTTIPDLPFTGRNVDVVICDTHGWEPNHPEFLDSNGVSRAVAYDWFQHSQEVEGYNRGVYGYDTASTGYHGIHVASTVAGLNEGWAKDANIYHLGLSLGGGGSPGSGSSYVSTSVCFDYIRAFHNAKSINPATGYKNPTIVNCSWGSSSTAPSASSVTALNIDGQTVLPGGGQPVTEYVGYYGPGTSTAYSTTLPADPEDASFRFTTAGTGGTVATDRMVDWPTDWTKITNQTYDYNSSSVYDTYVVEVQRPCDVKQNNRIQIDCNSSATYADISSQLGSGGSITTRVYGPNIDYSLTSGYGLGGTGTETITYSVSVEWADSEIVEFDNAWTVTTNERGGFFPLSDEDAADLANAPDREFQESDTIEAPPSDNTATVTQITHSPIASTTGLTVSTTPDVSAENTTTPNDDGYWIIDLPFNISFYGATQSRVYVTTNGMLTFNEGYSGYQLSPTVPALPKIGCAAGDRYTYQIAHGVTGTSPNRTYRIVVDAHSGYTPPSSGASDPYLRYEVVFYESVTNQFDIIFERNECQTTTGGGGQFTVTELNNYGYNPLMRYGYPSNAVTSAAEDAIDAGVMICVAAGNGYSPGYRTSTSSRAFNYASTSGGNRYFNACGSPLGAYQSNIELSAIGVGAMDYALVSSQENKVNFSDFGDEIDIWSAGNYIQGAYPSSAIGGSSRTTGTGTWQYKKISGTSMATPQVCGLLACMLEKYPWMTQRELRRFLNKVSMHGFMYKPSSYFDFGGQNGLAGAADKILKYPFPRKANNKPKYPDPAYLGRPRTGVGYPRTKIRRGD